MIEKNVVLRKQRVKNYFIDAAIEIARVKGVEAITLREVADTAGYNSATIYNYYEDLNELVGCACIRILKGYLESLNEILTDSRKNSLQKYLELWKHYCINSFGEDSAIYMEIFYKNNGSVLRYIEKYFSEFPEDLQNMGAEVKKVILMQNPLIQDQYLLDNCVRDGFIEMKDKNPVVRFSNWLHLGMLSTSLSDGEYHAFSAEEMTDIFLDNLTELLKPRLKVEMKLVI